MFDLKSLETTALIELLAQQTANYSSKIVERNNHFAELSKYEYEIAMIQRELTTRKAASNDTSVAGPQ